MKTGINRGVAGRSRYERLEARISSDLKLLFQRAADMRGVTLSDFIINSAHDVAVQTVEQHNFIQLNREATARFVRALQRPARSIPRLKLAADRHLKPSRRR